MRESIGFGVLLLCVVGCNSMPRIRQVTYTGSDFAFQGPDTVAAGPTRFRFKNAGSVNHELALALLRPGVTGAQALAAELSGADVDSVYEADGLLYLPLGEQVDMSLAIDLQPGRNYVLMCTLDAGNRKTPHVQLGMFKSLTVLTR